MNDGNQTPNNSFVLRNAADTHLLQVQQNGNVGIGTSSPGQSWMWYAQMRQIPAFK